MQTPVQHGLDGVPARGVTGRGFVPEKKSVRNYLPVNTPRRVVIVNAAGVEEPLRILLPPYGSITVRESNAQDPAGVFSLQRPVVYFFQELHDLPAEVFR